MPTIIMYFNVALGIAFFFMLPPIYIIASCITWRMEKKMLTDKILHICYNLNNDVATHGYFNSIVALTLDCGAVVLSTTLLHLWLKGLFRIDYFVLLWLVGLFYSFCAVVTRGITLGKWVSGLCFRDSNGECPTRGVLVKRELFGKLFMPFVPIFILCALLGIVDFYCITLWAITIVGYIAIIYFICNGRMWWSNGSVFKTTTTKYCLFPSIVLFLFLVACYFTAVIINNKQHNEHRTIMGFSEPLSFAYPQKENISPYTDFLKEQKFSAKDYVLNLFRNYDVVVIGESFHGECTQWQLIAEIVKDSFFIDSVGVVFSEYGSKSHQDRLDIFLKTEFDSDTGRMKAAAQLMWFMSGGFYDYLLELNITNSMLPQNRKITHFFTDIIDWDYFVTGSRKTVPDIEHRDSLMAQTVIDWYGKAKKAGKRKKCLVVTNYRHAFGRPANGFTPKIDFLNLTAGNEAQYICKALQFETANVLRVAPTSIKRLFFIFPVYAPINGGLWDMALEQNGCSVGFNMKGSPFGNDAFDLYPLRGARIPYHFDDFFVGAIYDRPFTQYQANGYPFQRYAMQKEYEQKKDSLSASVQTYINSSFNDNVSDNTIALKRTIVPSQRIEIFIFIAVQFLCSLLLLVLMVRAIRH